MNNIQKFENRTMTALQAYAMVVQTEKQLKEQKAALVEKLLKKMEEYGLASFENEILRINYIAESESVTIDTKELLKNEPDLYHEIEDKYNKRTTKKAHVRITVK